MIPGITKNTLNLKPVAFNDLVQNTGNIYDTVNIICKRAKILNVRSKVELDKLLEEFGTPSTSDDLSYMEECATICRSFDSQPKPHLQATKEMLNNDLYCVDINDQETL